jgi:hypothetical protein
VASGFSRKDVAVVNLGSARAAFRLKAEATLTRISWLPALAGRLRPAFGFRLKAEATTELESPPDVD